MIIKEENSFNEVENDSAQISIVIATYNAAKYLQKCLNSIYNQQYKGINIIVIDGKSTDGTVKILRDNTERIHFWLSEKDSGIYNALNKGLKYVKGNWVYFLGSDDELLPDFSKLALELADSNTIYYSNVIHKGMKRPGRVSNYYMAKVGIYHQAIIYPVAVFKKYQYTLKYKIAADYALNMGCFKDKAFRFEYKEYVITQYNHTGISSIEIDMPFEKDKSTLILENFGLTIWLQFMFRQFKKVFYGPLKNLLSKAG